MGGKLDEAARQTALAGLEGWSLVDGRDAIQKTYQFKNFAQAFAWMTNVAAVAERMDHHPEWRNVYRTVEVVLSTHDAGGLTSRDISLAKEMDDLAGPAQDAKTLPSRSETAMGGPSLDDAAAQTTGTP